MKLLLVIPSFRGGGAERVFIDLASGLAKIGYEVTLVSLSSEGDYFRSLPRDLSIKVLKGGGLKNNIWSLAELLRETHPDVVVSALTHINIGVVLARSLSRCRSKIVVTEHNPFGVEKRGMTSFGRIFSYFGAFVSYRCADRIVAVSHGVKKSIISALRINEKKVSVIYNPIDIGRVTGMCSESRIDSDHQRPTVVTVGRLVPQKRHDVLIRSIAILKQKKCPVRLLLIGDGDLLAELQQLAKSLGVEEDVQFLGFLDNPFEVIAGSDVFALSSDFEGFGNVLVEALALGVPVVSTDCEVGPREVLNSGEFGVLVKTNDPEALSEGLRGVLEGRVKFDNNSLRERANEFGLGPALSRYDALLKSF